MPESEKSRIVDSAKESAKFFSCDIVLKIFGVVIWEYHFPPKN